MTTVVHASVCPKNCIDVKEDDIIIDHKSCIDCDLCIYLSHRSIRIC